MRRRGITQLDRVVAVVVESHRDFPPAAGKVMCDDAIKRNMYISHLRFFASRLSRHEEPLNDNVVVCGGGGNHLDGVTTVGCVLCVIPEIKGFGVFFQIILYIQSGIR